MNRNEARRFLLLILLCTLLTDYRVNSDSDARLSRRRRYVVFPEGSTFSIALCVTVHTVTPDNIFTEGINWGISYDLPNESKPALEPFLQLRHDRVKPVKKYGSQYPSDKNVVKYSGWNSDKYYVKPGKRKYLKPDYYYLQRRHRRELYSKLETIMNAMNFDGRTCILRALCEASQRLLPKGNTLVEEMMRISFSFPLKRLFEHEPEEHHAYSRARKAGHEGHDCAAMFAGCSLSLIDMALGKYDAAESPPLATPEYTDESYSYGGWARYNMK
ncbi:uncharacterized protein LOC100864698 [Apis florea]|uniref:uncharacterized protein LOC100864698 n=1 Tax=Apis florea TaxID=7463 RepID=UPI000629AA9F|nr:uncharacterized protein LOC100864698 [Apis florea]